MRTWLNGWRRKTSGRTIRRPVSVKLSVTPLEDRTVPTTWTVTSLADAGSGTLREAIYLAGNGDLIQFDPSLASQTIDLTSGQLEIDKNLTIAAPAQNWITIQR